MEFFSVLLTIIIVFWLLGFVFRIALRAWLLKNQQRFAQNFSQYNQSSSNNAKKQRAEGTVEVQKTVETPKSVAKQVGDYVEFEEEVVDSNNN